MDAIDDHARLGPFFQIEAHLAPRAPWRPLDDLLGDRRVLDDWRDAARMRLARRHGCRASTMDTRALGSVLHLGLSARLVSPWLAAALLRSDLFVPRPSDLWWQDDGTTMFPLAVTGEAGHEPVGAQAFAERLVERILQPLAATGLVTSSGILWGNAASAVQGAIRTIDRHHPEARVIAGVIGQACLAALPWPDVARGEMGTTSFRRRSCCLAHALPGGSTDAVCGDCVLRERNREDRG